MCIDLSSLAATARDFIRRARMILGCTFLWLLQKQLAGHWCRLRGTQIILRRDWYRLLHRPSIMLCLLGGSLSVTQSGIICVPINNQQTKSNHCFIHDLIRNSKTERWAKNFTGQTRFLSPVSNITFTAVVVSVKKFFTYAVTICAIWFVLETMGM